MYSINTRKQYEGFASALYLQNNASHANSDWLLLSNVCFTQTQSIQNKQTRQIPAHTLLNFCV